jgi:uncharacterized Ntn-hydrolase superfamily protein
MNKHFFTLIFLSLLFVTGVRSQDTFSIVALDSVTGEVGSAGASCVDMSNFPGYDDDFLGELFPGVGAINTQAWYNATNQANARNRMNLGDTPAQIIQWLIEHDAQNTPQKRQYGIVAFVDGSPQSAAFTGTSTDDYKSHITGPNYSIQGNILLGQVVLDSMESRFLHAEGDLACKLMAALQGAKRVGADSRCTSNGTSSLFSFVKVAQPADLFGEPSFLLSVHTSSGAGIEPIDSLQTKFDLVHACSGVGVNDNNGFSSGFLIYPNPVTDVLIVENMTSEVVGIEIIDLVGRTLIHYPFSRKLEVDVSGLPKGIYLVRISGKSNHFTTKIVRN